MLYKIREIVFGLNEYEKTKIDFRFNLLLDILDEIKIQELKDFEILEECISKIKDLLRLKSSNLNKIISDPKKKLSKRTINQILEKLNFIKYDFLKRAFTVLKDSNNYSSNNKFNQSNKNNLDNSQFENKDEDLSENISILNEENIKKDEKLQENNIQKEQTIKEEQNPENLNIINQDNNQIKSNILLKDTQYAKITLENGKIPYILINFKEIIDFYLIKVFSSILYEEYKADGTNVIIEGNRVLIIPRFNNDNLFDLPRVQINIDEVFEKISSNLNLEKKTNSQDYINMNTKKQNFEEESVDNNDKQVNNNNNNNNNNQDKYVEYNDSLPAFKTKKYEEDSLDDLLLKTSKPDFSKHPDPRDDKSGVVFEEGEGVLLEREEKKEEKKEEDEVQIIKQNPNEKKDNQLNNNKKQERTNNANIINNKKSQKKENLGDDYYSSNDRIIKNNNVEKNIEIKTDDINKDKNNLGKNNLDNNKLENNLDEPTENINKTNTKKDISHKFTVYKDEKIIVYLKEDSSVLGELIIESLSNQALENDLSYMMIFSKIFASVLFEELKAHGTNIIIDYKNNLIRVIPRYQEDNLKINWEPKQESDSLLEDIRNKFLKKLSQESNSQETNNNQSQTNHNQETNQDNEKLDEKIQTDDEKKRKAKYILDQIRKIP